MKPFTITLQLNEVEIGGYLLDATVRVAIVDQGIGSYEFWGMRGVDSRMGIDEVEILEAEFLPGQEHVPTDAVAWLEQAENEHELYREIDQAWDAQDCLH